MSYNKNQFNVDFRKKRSYKDEFEIFDFENCLDETLVQYKRRNFFRIAIISGDRLYHYADKIVRISGTTLISFSPDVPYRFELLNMKTKGCVCIFRETFFGKRYTENIRHLPMFAVSGIPDYSLSKAQNIFVNQIFRKMKSELKSDYVFRLDLIRNYVTELIHYTMKMEHYG